MVIQFARKKSLVLTKSTLVRRGIAT